MATVCGATTRQAVENPALIDKLLFRYRSLNLSGSNGSEITSWNGEGPHNLVLSDIGGTSDRPTLVTADLNGWNTAACANLHGMTVSSANSVPTAGNTWTLFAVVMFTTVTAFTNFFSFGNGTSEGFRIGLNTSGKLAGSIPNVADWTSNYTWTINTWHYLVMIANAGTYSLYVDGSSQTFAATPSGSINGSPSSIKVLDGDTRFQGKLAEIAAYDKAVGTTDRQNNLEAYAHTVYGI